MVSWRAPALGGVPLLASLLGGCSLITDSFVSNDFSGDPLPVEIDLTSGAVMVGLHPEKPDGDGISRPAVLDVLSPLTIIDPGPDSVPQVSFVDLTLLGDSPLASNQTVPRARFPEAQLLAVHPCNSVEADADGVCHVGPTGETIYQSIIGADALAGDAIRLRLGDRRLFVLPDVGGSDRARSFDCDAVFDSPYRGGGTLVIAGTELSFGNRRIVLQACLSPHPDARPQAARGSDALFVLSTGIGTSIIGQTAYNRYLELHPEQPALASLPEDSVYMPGGILRGQRGMIDTLSLVAAPGGNDLSPCRQIYAHRALAPASLGDDCKTTTGDDCPCDDGTTFCNVPAIVELTPPGGIAVLVISDTDSTLQALRAELRPDQPEVDGILGTDVLRGAELDIDYPHDRLLARCAGGDCCVRPELTSEDDRDGINRCITHQATCATTSVLPEP